MDRKSLILYLNNVSVILIALVAFLFPVFFLTTTTDFFIFPKQILVIIVSAILVLLLAFRMIIEGRLSLRATPFSLAYLVFSIAVFISSVLSRNIYDSLFQSIPQLFLLGLYLVVINQVDNKLSFKIIFYSLFAGAIVTSVISILSFFKLYIFPFAETQNQFFNTFGSPVQQIVYLFPLLLVAAFSIAKNVKKKEFTNESILYGLTLAVTLISMGLFFYELFFSKQKVASLPFQYGIQIAFASISQDAGRILLSLFFGSGYGTFATDFTRFKILSFNQEQDIWNLVFSYSSSYVLELLATTGIIGTLSFIYLAIRTFRTRLPKGSPLYITLVILFILSIFVPFSFSILFLLTILLGLYASELYLERSKYVHNVTLTLVAFKQGLISLESEKATAAQPQVEESKVLPIIVFLVVLAIVAFGAVMSFELFLSDMTFRQSLLEASQNKGKETYDLQRQAIATFPYRSDYYRLFSQINFALANSLAATISQPKQGQQLSAQDTQTQQNVVTLIQQSINSARAAATLSPLTATNWENLGQVYKGLINVGQNADQFAIASLNQTITLDPYNPQLYIELGGIYYQLGQYDNAANQFRIAINLKSDLANSYYNLGHALEAKGDLQGALTEYQAVQSLTQGNKAALDQINAEIDAIQKKIGNGSQAQGTTTPEPQAPATAATNEKQPPLKVSSTSGQIPAQEVPVKLPPPPQSSGSAR